MVDFGSFQSRRLRLIQAKKRSTTTALDEQRSRPDPSAFGLFQHRRASHFAVCHQSSACRKVLGHEREGYAGQSQDWDHSIAVLNVSRLRIDHGSTPVHIHHCLPLATFNLLSRVVATWTPAFGGPDTLAVHYRGAWGGLAAASLTIHHDETMIDPSENTGVTPAAKITEHRALRMQVSWDHPPRGTTAKNVEDRVDDLP
jgi:hypothetical protein